MSRRLVWSAVVLVALLVAGGLLAWRLSAPDPGMARALDLAPAGTERVTWTDWAAVRRSLDADLDADSPTEDLEAFLDEAFAQDLSSTSALLASAATLHEELGLSPANLEWEMLAQGPDGAVEVLGPAPDTDLDDLRERLAELGWEEPDEADGVWRGGPSVLPSVGPGLTPELQHVAVLDDAGVVLTSDQEGYLARAVEVARGDGEAVAGLDDVVADLEEPVSAVAYTAAHVCERLAMSQADAGSQETSDQLIESAGGVHPLTAFAMGKRAGGVVRVAMEVEDAEDAAADAAARAALAQGPAVGQGGDFADRFEVAEASSKGRVVRLDLLPREESYVLSDLSSGPVLFATC
ncbi:hypothetical protein EXE58_10360 [Nocardioides seonyuensis]|uniref:DUF3352 domain-containing protein n=1 Tax=Nocardioides seonyuensis TaxID=2518371 RepID=A0A4P7IEX8_9ACTN|nr:hypothetical protein [Nocardioides seonyuensis]QBX55819.1 hypothetical protein EXE58_10360 [Nocardioides seonyuensis]